MKKIMLSLIVSMFSLMMFSQTYDVTISGVVTSEITGDAVPLQEMVIITDSSVGSGFLYYNTVFTDDYGYYVDVMQVPSGVEGIVEVSTLACNTILSQTGTFSDPSSPLTFDFQICDDSIGNECQAMFFYYPGDTPLSIQFTDESWGFPTFWAWDFGDGETSSQAYPLHIYHDFGEYITTLTITSQDSTCYSTIEMLVLVMDDTTGPGVCQAMFFTYPDSSGYLTVNFMDMSYVESPSGIPDTWYWEFGDGNSSTEQNPTHTYYVEGDYDVCLSITSQYGDVNCESTECQITMVGDFDPGCFTWYEYQEIGDLSVDFQAYLDGGYYAEYTWDFGDGTTGTGATITHTYTESGMYEVVLTAVNQDSTGSCTSTYFDVVWVGENISFDIYGYVYLDDSLMADYANVYLMTLDTLGNGLVNIATTQVDTYGYYEFEEASLENCLYFVQADLTDQSVYYSDYIPTYHIDAVNWEEALPIFPSPSGWSYNIYMASTTSSNTGNGLITGTVTEEGSRELLSNIEVLLLDNDGNQIKYSRTNDNGVFNFSDLAMGTYTVYTEIVGIETIPFDVTLDEQNNNSTV
ncbi:MAG: PKD domain-containing protein, partial [Bacteroidota bacterium]